MEVVQRVNLVQSCLVSFARRIRLWCHDRLQLHRTMSKEFMLEDVKGSNAPTMGKNFGGRG